MYVQLYKTLLEHLPNFPCHFAFPLAMYEPFNHSTSVSTRDIARLFKFSCCRGCIVFLQCICNFNYYIFHFQMVCSFFFIYFILFSYAYFLLDLPLLFKNILSLLYILCPITFLSTMFSGLILLFFQLALVHDFLLQIVNSYYLDLYLRKCSEGWVEDDFPQIGKALLAVRCLGNHQPRTI